MHLIYASIIINNKQYIHTARGHTTENLVDRTNDVISSISLTVMFSLCYQTAAAAMQGRKEQRVLMKSESEVRNPTTSLSVMLNNE